MAAFSFAQAVAGDATGAEVASPNNSSRPPTSSSVQSKPIASHVDSVAADLSRALASAAAYSRAGTSQMPRRGPCNFRDLSLGHKCGCTTFWGDESRVSHSQQELHWCVCSHHACYHHLAEPSVSTLAAPGARRGSHVLPGGVMTARGADNGSYVNKSDAGAGSFRRPSIDSLALRENRPALASSIRQEKGRPSQSLENVNPASQGSLRFGQWLRNSASIAQGEAQLSIPSTATMPPIPSMCLLNSQDLRPIEDVARPPSSLSARDAPHGTIFAGLQNQPAGLGLTLGGAPKSSPQSSPRIDKQMSPYTQAAKVNDSQSRLSRPSSVSDHGPRASPSRAFMHTIMERRLAPPITTHAQDTLPDPANPEDLIVSATEMATPSVSNTPDLRSVEQTVGEAKNLADWLTNTLLDPEQKNASQPGEGKTSAPGSFTTISNGSIRAALSKLCIRLGTLQSHVSAYPNLARSVKELADRMDNLESMSFSHVHPDEIAERFEHFDARILDLEGWRDDQDKHYAVIDADNNMRDQLAKINASAAQSFNSNDFVPVDREEIQDIKERLDDLETAMPSSVNPWEVEVILLPWGPDLKGVWFVPDETDSWKASVRDTEEWTQARSLAFSKGSALNSSFSSGWSNEEIAGWADRTTEWLSPKACGTRNLVYKRLQSRGFVRNVKFTSPNAGDIQAAIARSFAHLQNSLEASAAHSEPDGEVAEEDAINRLPGLRATFIPLRKVLHSSRLRFLSRSEMATSALWTAQFLSSGIMMRVSGGVKRLFVTHRHAYLQPDRSEVEGWTWQRLRELPRVRLEDDDQQMESDDSEQHVAEADAREGCWAYSVSLDPPATATSSFCSNASSHASQGLSKESSSPSNQHHACVTRKTPQSSVLSTSKQPISPLSEFPPSRRRPRHARNSSTSIPDSDGHSSLRYPQGRRSFSGKRLLNSFDAISKAEQRSASLPRTTKARKRRRLTRSPDLDSFVSRRQSTTRLEEGTHDIDHEFEHDNLDDDIDNDNDNDNDSDDPISVAFTTGNAYNYTPRRSKEPSSPFFEPRALSSNHPNANRPSTAPVNVFANQAVHGNSGMSAANLARHFPNTGMGLRKASGGSTSTSIHGAAGPSMSVSAKGPGTPFAYATPHSGMGVGTVRDIGLDEGGDTEVDGSGSDSGDSWRGIGGEDEDDGVGDEGEDAEAGALGRSFRSDDDGGSGFDFEEEDDDEAEYGHNDDGEDEDEEDGEMESQEMELDGDEEHEEDEESEDGFGDDVP